MFSAVQMLSLSVMFAGSSVRMSAVRANTRLPPRLGVPAATSDEPDLALELAPEPPEPPQAARAIVEASTAANAISLRCISVSPPESARQHGHWWLIEPA